MREALLEMQAERDEAADLGELLDIAQRQYNATASLLGQFASDNDRLRERVTRLEVDFVARECRRPAWLRWLNRLYDRGTA